MGYLSMCQSCPAHLQSPPEPLAGVPLCHLGCKCDARSHPVMNTNGGRDQLWAGKSVMKLNVTKRMSITHVFAAKSPSPPRPTTYFSAKSLQLSLACKTPGDELTRRTPSPASRRDVDGCVRRIVSCSPPLLRYSSLS